MRHFFILGNMGSGTSLLRGLLNAHSFCNVVFEDLQIKNLIRDEFLRWNNLKNITEKKGCLWGNKIPVDVFDTARWNTNDILKIGRDYYILWVIRRFCQFKNSWNNWQRGQTLYWEFREKWPKKIIQVSFEDLLLRPDQELMRICIFLKIKYEKNMMSGTQNTGREEYNQTGINLGKL